MRTSRSSRRALAPFGSPSARVSAASILRVHEGGVEAPSAASNATGTMKPTAKSILARGGRPRSAITSYLASALLALGVAGGVVVGAVRYFGASAARTSATVAATVPSPAAVTSAEPHSNQTSAPTLAVLASREAPAERSHHRPHHPAPLASAAPSPPPLLDDAGPNPYDAP